MKIFFDLEFTGLTQSDHPVSIGLISEDRRAFYGEFTDFEVELADEWVQRNVLSKLWLYQPEQGRPIPGNLTYRAGTCFDLAVAVAGWLGQFPGTIEMWGDVLPYDWVHFCELFGGSMKLPPSIYYIPFDLATLLKIKGIDPDIERKEFADLKGADELSVHTAIYDATLILACYEKAMGIVTHPYKAGYVGVANALKRDET